jgi:hypothetical protein
VRNRALHDQLERFCKAVAERLHREIEAGAEIPFEVVEKPGASSVLYHYEPLSGEFLRERYGQLRSLAGYDQCLSALARVEGTGAYLRTLGVAHTPAGDRDRADAVLRELLAQVWRESTSFEFETGRLQRAYLQFESIVYEDTVVNTVIVPIVGVRLAGERWELGGGIELVRGDLADAPPEAVWGFAADETDGPATLATISVESTPSEPPPLTMARLDFRKLLTTLRLLESGPAALGPHAWWRTDDGPWQSVPLGHAGRTRGGEYWLEADDREGLCELFEIVRARPSQGGSLAWALSRFELGLEQPVATDGLSDHLLAVRALLDGGEPTSLAMAQRLAALCVESEKRAQTRARIEKAFQLERRLMRGEADSMYLDAVGADAPDRIAGDLERLLRALLRDMVCGHVTGDLRALADEMLGVGEGGERDETDTEPRVIANRRPTQRSKPEPKTEPVLAGWGEMETAPQTEPVTAAEPEFVARRIARPEPASVRELRDSDDVDDWGFDDPADYSAAV